jgi:PIN domain nuclease of toxin-antitoxin system
VSAAIAPQAGLLSSKIRGDPPDRLVIATALDLRGRLVTQDRKISASKLVPIVWEGRVLPDLVVLSEISCC